MTLPPVAQANAAAPAGCLVCANQGTWPEAYKRNTSGFKNLKNRKLQGERFEEEGNGHLVPTQNRRRGTEEPAGPSASVPVPAPPACAQAAADVPEAAVCTWKIADGIGQTVEVLGEDTDFVGERQFTDVGCDWQVQP